MRKIIILIGIILLYFIFGGLELDTMFFLKILFTLLILPIVLAFSTTIIINLITKEYKKDIF